MESHWFVIYSPVKKRTFLGSITYFFLLSKTYSGRPLEVLHYPGPSLVFDESYAVFLSFRLLNTENYPLVWW